MTLLFSTGAYAKGDYRVTHIVDGDTLEATDGNITFRVRIAGMDAPEWKQRFGRQATNRLRQLTLNKKITIHPLEKMRDKYGRLLGHVFVGKKDVSLVMIGEGLAFYSRPFCRDYPKDRERYDYSPLPYVQAELRAKIKGRGVWIQDPLILPCAYRKQHPYRP
ncbi:MAG: thermonuclease family protein [Deltaproteobacteria bacterium]|nr:thermonuclease family protein [Deltaproteobacteria bacterium]